MATPDIDVIKEIPGYKVILKAVLKSQIQQLVEQLAATTDEESVILTASISDGTLSHLGSSSGKSFLEDHEDIKSQFLGFCLKRHHKQQDEAEAAFQQSRNVIEMHGTPSRSQRFVSPVGPPFPAARRRGARHEPYHIARHRRPSNETVPAPTAQEKMIKIEPGSIIGGADTVNKDTTDNSSVEANTLSGSNNMDNGVKLPNETASGLSGLITMPGQQSGENTETDANVSVKLEALTDSEMDLEITGVEPGNQIEAQASWDPNNFELPGGSGGQGEAATQGYAAKVRKIPSPQDHGNSKTLQNVVQIKQRDDVTETFQDVGKKLKARLCKTCGKEFQSRSGLYEHEMRHAKKAPYVCCGKTFFSKANITRHRCSFHEEIKKCVCTTCGELFATVADVNRHKLIHEAPMYLCSECGQVSRSKQRHLDHVAGHSGEKNHFCFCGKVFAYRSSLYRHSKNCKK